MSKLDDIILQHFKDLDDEKAMEYIFHVYYPALCSYASSIVKSSEDAKDVVNDCFLELWNRHELLKITTSLKSYLYVAVRNAAINYLKKKKKEQKFVSSQSYPFYLQDEVTSRIEKLERIENLEKRLKEAIDSLPQQCRYIFYLNRFEKLGYKEIAVKLNLSVGTVKTQIARALKKLRAEFEDVDLNNPILFYIFVRHFCLSLSYR